MNYYDDQRNLRKKDFADENLRFSTEPARSAPAVRAGAVAAGR